MNSNMELQDGLQLVGNAVSDTADKLKHEKKTIHNIDIIFIIVFICIVVICVSVGAGTVRNMNKSAIAAYSTAKDQTATEISEELYNLGFNQAETNYHVRNRATLSVSELKKVSKLQVLKISDIEYVTIQQDENDEGITAILEVPGTGTYTVDLDKAEYIVDTERSFVLVRLPNPELGEYNIDYSNVIKRLFNDSGFNESYSVGEDMARKMLKEGLLKIQSEIASDARYYESAKSSAENMVRNMVKSFNPNVENLQVDVEFYE